MLKSKITRTIAFIISCCLVGYIAFSIGETANRIDESTVSLEFDEQHRQLKENQQDAFRDLWYITVMYLRNLDEKGNFKGTDALKKQTFDFLKENSLMNEKNEITFNNKYGFDYYAAYGKHSFTNADKSLTELGNEFSYYENNGTWNANVDRNFYVTNYGMTYYYFDNKGTALFDFDTTGLNFYVDELGANIYYKTDGSTPYPADYLKDNDMAFSHNSLSDRLKGELELATKKNAPDANTDRTVTDTDGGIRYYDKYGNEYYEEYEEYDDYQIDSGIYYYSEDGWFYKVNEAEFSKNEGNTLPVTIVIAPDETNTARLYDLLDSVRKNSSLAEHEVAGLVPFAAAAFILAVYVLIAGGYSRKEKKFVLAAYDKVYAELPLIFAILAIAGAAIFVEAYNYNELRDIFYDLYGKQYFTISFGIYYGILFAIGLSSLNTLIIRMKCHSLLKTLLTGNIISRIFGKLIRCFKRFRKKFNETLITREMMRNDRFIRSFVTRFAIFFALELFTALITLAMYENFLFLVCTFILLAFYIWLNLKDLRALTRLNEHISAICAGDHTARTEPVDSVIYSSTQKLNNISSGMQTAVERQLKSERMKIDLVTNVSHDLKTPLTSIISYIDLLSAEELTPAARDYVTIIEKKADRLKVMVADLFDLAKATSRTDVSLEQIDAVVLTNQVLGDLADKIEASGKVIKTDIQADSAPVRADGKRMYRVFQNLIDNALKYSLDGTRIYISLKKEAGRCIIAVKNIASYEMDFTPDEIMERFARGDSSRSTEGNGLGLSIAKSFTEACGGEFEIAIDGDLFTAVLKLDIDLTPKKEIEIKTED